MMGDQLEEGTGSAEVDAAAAVESALTGGGEQQPQEQPEGKQTQTPGPTEQQGFNPAWTPIKDRLGDASFGLIQDELAKWDKSAQQRIESLNSEFSPYKELGTIDELKLYKGIVDNLNNNPEEMYQRLGQFLKENGRLPNAQEAEQIADDVEDEAPQEDPRLAQLMQENEQIKQFLLAQQEEAAVEREYQTLQQDAAQLKEQRGYGDEDWEEVLRIAYSLNQQDQNRFVPLSEAADQFDTLRNRILSTPRPGDSAPRLLPTNGGASPATQQPKPIGERSRDETQDLVAAMLAQAKGQ